MRELKPLHLPILVAARYSSDKQVPEDVTMARVHQHHNVFSQTSLASTALSSTPPTPTSSVFSHSRHPSTQSAYSSATSPGLDQPETTAPANKLPLPQLTEEPFEAEEAMLTLTANQQSTMFAPYKFPMTHSTELQTSLPSRCLDSAFSDYRTTIVRHDAFNDWVVGNECFFKSPVHQRQNSGEPAPSAAPQRLPRKMASFSSSLRHRKQDSMMSNSGLYIHTASTQTSSTRTSSMTSSVFDNADFATHMRSRKSSDVSASCPTSPIDSTIRLVQESNDREKFPVTPLLPPIALEQPKAGQRFASPLQSPLFPSTPAMLSMRNTPSTTPQIGGVSPKLLSSKTSFASLRHPRLPSNGSSPQILPFFIADPNDKWAAELGHANFNIEPAPYTPVENTTTSLSQLNMDYEEAKLNYFRHNMRTIEHYGQNSRTFKLTEQKWAEVDAEWRANVESTTRKVALNGPTGELFPAFRPGPVLPLSIMTKLPDMRNQNKFPDLGDVDIVGPMTQVPARAAEMIPSPTSPRGRSFFKLFSGRSRSRKP